MDLTFTTAPSSLLPHLGTADAPRLIDVCVPEDVAALPYRVPGAIRVRHDDTDGLRATAHPDRPNVVICQKGRKLSHGAAAILRAHGLVARVLDGGMVAWANAQLPVIDETAASETYVLTPCDAAWGQAWVLRRWIAPRARILWVPHETVSDVADRFDGVAITPDIPPANLAQSVGLDWPPLSAFLSHAETALWNTLLPAFSTLYPTPETASAAAMPVIDAAWITQAQAVAA